MANLARLELWTDFRPSGTAERRAVFADLLACSERVSLQGEDTLSIVLHADNPAMDEVVLNRVIRAIHEDGSIVERRLTGVTRSDERGDLRVTLTAQGMMQELGAHGMVYRENADGSRSHAFTAAAMSVFDHVQEYVRRALYETNQAWWIAGTIEETGLLTVIYDRDSPLSALRKICAASPGGLELAIRYDQRLASYCFDFLRSVGATATPVRLRADHNLARLNVAEALDDVVTRVYAFGGADLQRGVASMDENVWEIHSLNTQRSDGLWAVYARDPGGGRGPIAVDHQYAPSSATAYQLVPLARADLAIAAYGAGDNPTFAVVDSLVDAQTFVVQPQTGVSLHNGWYTIRRVGSPAPPLSFVDNPDAIAAYGYRTGYVDIGDTPGAINYIANPMLRLWQMQNVPPVPWGWAWGGGATLAQTTSESEWRTAGSALRVTMPSGSYVEARAYWAVPTHGKLSFYADIMPTNGIIDVQLIVTLKNPTVTPDGVTRTTLTYPEHLHLLNPDVTYQRWVSAGSKNAYARVGWEACHDCDLYPIVGAKVRITPSFLYVAGMVGPVSGVIDGASITATPEFADLVEPSGGTALLQTANAKLAIYSTLARSVQADLLDLHTFDPTTFPYDNLVVGGPVVITDDDLGLEVSTRIMGWTRDWLARDLTSLDISTPRTDLGSLLTIRPVTPRPKVLLGG